MSLQPSLECSCIEDNEEGCSYYELLSKTPLLYHLQIPFPIIRLSIKSKIILDSTRSFFAKVIFRHTDIIFKIHDNIKCLTQ